MNKPAEKPIVELQKVQMSRNVFQRLNDAREEFHTLQLKKTGHNKFAGYNYFELADFLIPAMRVFKKHGLLGIVRFGTDLAEMVIVNVDNPTDFYQITSPMSSAALKGCHEVQNLGAVQTYLRRYLWVAALEIVEHDAIDSSEPINKMLEEFRAAALEGSEALNNLWKQKKSDKGFGDFWKEHGPSLKKAAQEADNGSAN